MQDRARYRDTDDALLRDPNNNVRFAYTLHKLTITADSITIAREKKERIVDTIERHHGRPNREIAPTVRMIVYRE